MTEIYSSNLNDRLETLWASHMNAHPEVADATSLSLDVIREEGQFLFTSISQLAASSDLPVVDTQAMQPILKLWHSILTHQSQQSIPLRDTAKLLLSLKSAVSSWEGSGGEGDSTFDRVNRILDILGMLTFEMYSQEQSQLIQRQSAHISYLQQNAQDGDWVANSAPMQSVLKATQLIVDTTVPVLLCGETGVGKERVAQIIHHQSRRSDGPFVVVNCGAIPRDLVEAELFGYEKGAFTGADVARMGRFEQADTGTLFLDEIGDLPLDAQVKLLRILQNNEVQKIGSNQPVKVDVRIVAATHRNLESEVAEGRFREDLFYRLNVYPITIPPLRVRGDDILVLAHTCIARASREFLVPFGGFTLDAERWMRDHLWPGNVRELENLMKRACLLAQGRPVTSEILTMSPASYANSPHALHAPVSEPNQILTLATMEKQAIESALTLKNGNVAAVAKALGISRSTLYAKAKRYHIRTIFP
ncbi:sigma-54-dependent Fis family transcriptional regulator [bacterium]|nr:sigma-54-dependent Fis family transcriptional regulator [bacterium]